MADEQRQAFCPRCGAWRRFVRPSPSIGTWHLIHLLITLCSFGAWAAVWLAHVAIRAQSVGPFRCHQCGQEPDPPGTCRRDLVAEAEARRRAAAEAEEADRQARIARALAKRQAKLDARRLANQWDTLPRSHGPGPD